MQAVTYSVTTFVFQDVLGQPNRVEARLTIDRAEGKLHQLAYLNLIIDFDDTMTIGSVKAMAIAKAREVLAAMTA